MKTQKTTGAQTSKTSTAKKETTKDLKTEDLKKVNGGSGLLSGGNDLTNIIAGTATVSNHSSGSHNGESYTSDDSHSVDLGLGNMLNNTNF